MLEGNMFKTREEKIEKLLRGDVLNPKVKDFVNESLREKLHCFLIGGAVRAAIENRCPRDMDILLEDGNEGILIEYLRACRLNYKKNAFNGFKVSIDNFSIDIWFMRDHYLFKNKVYKVNTRNIKRSTLINYDSLVYDMSRKKLDSKNYDRCISEELIDFVGNDDAVFSNPMPILSIIKLMDIKYNKKLNFSLRVKDYIAYNYGSFGESLWRKIAKEYKRHYNMSITDEYLKFIMKEVREVHRESFKRSSLKYSVPGQYSIFDY